MIKNDLHIHSIHSACGMHTVLEIVQIATAKGMNLINISDHGKSSGKRPNFTVICDRRRLPDPVQAPDGSEMRVLRGMEANILDREGRTDISHRSLGRFDLISVGLHPASGLPQYASEAENTEAVVNAVKNNPVDILTHPCIMTFPLNLPVIVDLSVAYGVALEVNNTNLRLGKTDKKKLEKLITLAVDKQALLVENSDGHTYHEIGENEKVEEFITGMGLDGGELFKNRKEGWVHGFVRERKNLRKNIADSASG